MHEFRKQKLGWTGPALALVGLLVLPKAGVAGTGRLLSQWMSQAPRIDGQLAAGEWSAATLVPTSNPDVTLRIGNDARTLYLAVLDAGDLGAGGVDMVFLPFDDEGGLSPILDDSAYANPTCLATPNLGEGGLTFQNGGNVQFDESYSGGACPSQIISDRMSYQSSPQLNGMSYEMAIPLDGRAPIQAGPGQRFAFYLRVFRNGALVACFPSCMFIDPPAFRNLVLASGGCNTGPQTFGSGDPLVGLPLDWTSENTAGGGPGWVQAPPAQFGDPVFCQANDTGGTGGSACVANFFCTAPRTDSLLRMPLALDGMTAATVRARAVLQVAAPHEYLDVGIRRLDTSGNSLLFWLDENRNETVALWIPVAGSPPVEFWFTHSTFSGGGSEGGYAQIDDVELICGPRIFSDGFESGLTTHWSADSP